MASAVVDELGELPRGRNAHTRIVGSEQELVAALADPEHPAVAGTDLTAAVTFAEVLEAAGYRVQVPGADTCCGLTWITTGQLDAARRILGHTVAELAPVVDAGIPVVAPGARSSLRQQLERAMRREERTLQS